jgi:hypothetical protein
VVEQAGQRAHVVRAEDHIDPGGLVENGLLVHLRQAAPDGDLHACMLVLAGLQMPQRAVQLACGVVADRAGVDDDDVGVLAVTCGDIARALQRPGQPLGVVHVHLAAEGADLVGASATVGIDRGG